VSRKRRGRRAFDFSLGEALSKSLACFGKNFPVLAIFSLVLFAPLAWVWIQSADRVWQGVDSFARSFDGPELFWDRTTAELGAFGTLLGLMLPLLLQAVVTFGVFQYLGGGRANHGRSLQRGLQRLLPVVFVAILAGLLVILAMIPVMLLLGVVFSMAGVLGGIVAILAGGVVTMTIYSIFYVAIQACVVERMGPAKSLSRSSALTRGARWKIFALLLITFVVDGGVTWIVHKMIGATPETLSAVHVGVYVLIGTAAILAAFKSVAAAVVYQMLREAKEGVGIDELVRIFD